MKDITFENVWDHLLARVYSSFACDNSKGMIKKNIKIRYFATF